MNFAYLTEYSRSGLLSLPINEEFIYRKLKCSLKDVYKLESGDAPAVPLYTVRFCPVRAASHLVAVANEDGTVHVNDSRGGPVFTPVESFQAHYNAVFDLAWLENEVKLVTASGDHSALLWDLGKGEAVPVVRMVGHQGSVKSVACKPSDPNVFTTGARDGVIMQWDVRSNSCQTNVSFEEGFLSVKADKTIEFAHLKTFRPLVNRGTPKKSQAFNTSRCISSVAYQDATAIISSSSTDKFIKVWDTRKTYSAFKGIPTPMFTIARKSTSRDSTGYTNIAVSPCKLKLFAYCTDAKVYAFNIGTYSSEPVATYSSSGSSSFFCKINLSPDGKFLSCGSSDNMGYIWSVAQPGMHLVALKGHWAEVTCVDWCKYGALKLASCSDDGSCRVWRVSQDVDNTNIPAGSGYSVPYDPQEVGMTPKRRFTTKYFASHLTRSTSSKKRCRSHDEKASPHELSGSLAQNPAATTPKKLELVLSHLPNFVVDGNSPHGPSARPSLSSPAADGDWLSKLIAATPPPPSKPATSAKKTRRTPNQMSKSARGSLLKYFKKTEDSSNERNNESGDKL